VKGTPVVTRRRLLVAALFGSGLSIGWLRVFAPPVIDIQWDPIRSKGEEYQPDYRIDEGKELVLVAIVSSSCAWSNLPGTIEAIRRAKVLVQEQAHESDLGFVTMGVARDMVASAGIEHLEEMGRFDEVLAGRGWLNSGVLQFIYNDELPGWAATPQVVVIEQTVTLVAGARRIRDRREVLRKLGSEEIEEWVSGGALVPASAARSATE